MLQVQITDDSLRIGKQLTLSFHRTLRIPDDKRHYPLPPTFGRFPLAAFGAALPVGFAEAAIPIRNREALWIAFEGPTWRPNAVKVGLGTVNAVNGGAWTEPLRDEPQNYIVTDKQIWLDGVNVGHGHVRQFVATTLGEGLTVEEQVGGTQWGHIRIEVFEPKPGTSERIWRSPRPSSGVTKWSPELVVTWSQISLRSLRIYVTSTRRRNLWNSKRRKRLPKLPKSRATSWMGGAHSLRARA
jgi:hypothetical protein